MNNTTEKKPAREYSIYRVKRSKNDIKFLGYLISFDFNVSGKPDDNNVLRFTDEGVADALHFTNDEANAVLLLLRPLFKKNYELEKTRHVK